MDLPYNFVHQIQVRTGGVTAEDAQALGGVINVVTPSGGNQFHGQVFGFLSGDAMQTDPRAVLGATQTGFTLYDVGVSLSGPVVRDRLWFFAAYNPTYEGREHSFGFGAITDRTRQHLFASKLTWRASSRTTATLTVLGDPTRSDGANLPPFAGGQTVLNPEVVAITGEERGAGYSIRAQHLATPRLMLEGSIARMRRTEAAEPATAAGAAPVLIDYVTGTMSGGHGERERFESARTSLNVSATLTLPAHALRAGVGYDVLVNDMALLGSRATAGGFVQRVDTSQYTWFEFEGRGRIGNHQPTVFLEDAWQIGQRVIVSAGLRWSSQTIVNRDGDTTLHQIADGVQPRIGIAVQPGRIGGQRLFASYARVADQLAAWSAQYYGPGYYCSVTYPQDPRSDTTGGVPNFCFSGYVGPVGDRRLNGITSNEWTIGYERRLGARATIGVRAVRRAFDWVIEDGFDSTGALFFGNPGRGGLAAFPRAERTYQALEATIRAPAYQISYAWSRARGNFTGLYATDLRVAAPHIGPQFDHPEQLVNGTGLMPNDRTHVVKAFGAHRVRHDLVVGASFFVASGTPRSEYGGIPAGPPYWGFASTRGTAGRTPTIWDLGVRIAYDVPVGRQVGMHARTLLDVQHIGSPRRAVDYDQVHYTCPANNQSCVSASYGSVTAYQPPMTARLGVVVNF